MGSSAHHCVEHSTEPSAVMAGRLLLLSSLLSTSLTLPQSRRQPTTTCPPKNRTTRQTDCGSFEESGYFCVPYYQCDSCNRIITDGIGLIAPRSPEDQCPAG